MLSCLDGHKRTIIFWLHWQAGWLFLLHMSTASCTRRTVCSESSRKLAGYLVTEMKVSVTSGKAAHAVHTVFLSIPKVDDVTSHLVNEWGKKRASEYRGPSCWVMVWIEMSLNVFFPKSCAQLRQFQFIKDGKNHHISVHYPFSVAWCRCSIIRVSASSWESDKSVSLLLSTMPSFVVKTCVTSVVLTASWKEFILVFRLLEEILPVSSLWTGICAKTVVLITQFACICDLMVAS